MDFIRRDDLAFMLHDWLGVSDLTERPDFAEHSRETFDSILDLSADLARDSFAPHYKASDANEPFLDGATVVTLPAIGEALRTYAEAGFFGSGFPEQLGGIQLPTVISVASFAHFCAANLGTAGYPMLTAANARLIVEHGSEAQVEAWAAPQIEGRFFGTMCLSEPQAGSSLSDIKTSATSEASDALGERFRITGNKMWISGGDHELSENILHLVLAKAPGPDGTVRPGTKGISLFAVPKILPDGERNDITVIGLNHKMGYRGTVNCALSFGDNDGAIGWRIGGEGQGLPIMFQMMNEARIMVGLGAAALAYRGFQQSLVYARERPQGRLLAGEKDLSSAQVPIIEHPDVKRMLMKQKAIAEGALGLVLYTAKLADEVKTASNEEERRTSLALLNLLTPLTKSWPSEFGLVANEQAIQVLGGYGYSRDFDVEQIYRDNRLNPIHEGTHGIQGLDFLGRKVLGDRGETFLLLVERMRATINQAREIEYLAKHADELTFIVEDGVWTVDVLTAHSADEDILDNASVALSAFGHIVVAWIWLQMVIAAEQLGDDRAELRESKRAAFRFFFERELPRVKAQLSIVRLRNDAASSVPSNLI